MNKDWLILSFGLLSWGWLSQTLQVAAGLLVAISISKYCASRLNISTGQRYRWGDLSALLVILLLVDVYILQPTDQAIFILLKWLPVLFAPSLFAQIFRSNQKLPLAVLFDSFRKQQPEKAGYDYKPPYKSLYNRKSGVIRLLREIDFTLPYAGLTVLSAGAANVQSSAYFVIAATLFTGILWTVRPKQSSVPVWLLSIVFVIFMSHFGYQCLIQLNTLLEEKSIDWLSNRPIDPFKNHTSIGDIGELKLSDKILFRVKADGPLLLLQASYDLYSGHNWTISKPLFTTENPVTQTGKSKLKQLEIMQQFDRQTVLALPDGTVKISGLGDAYLEYTEFGAVKATHSPGFASYQAFYNGNRTGTPSKYDLQIPKQHLDWVQQLNNELKLATHPPEIIAERIKTYFQQYFFYSLYLGEETDPDQAIRAFMLKRKTGHCEYFAAATVLLLRQAGVPARYANGYSVEEFDNDQGLYVVRSRHAHAWAIAYLNGTWQVIDSTPSQWQAMESEHASLWQPLSDGWSNCLFRFRQWQLQQTGYKNAKLGLFSGLLLSIILGWSFYSARQKLNRNIQKAEKSEPEPVYKGMDSEFYLIEQSLKHTDQARQDNESIMQWAERLQLPSLNQLYKLHYQLRFDPMGLSKEQRLQLQQRVKAWVDNLGNSSIRH